MISALSQLINACPEMAKNKKWTCNIPCCWAGLWSLHVTYTKSCYWTNIVCGTEQTLYMSCGHLYYVVLSGKSSDDVLHCYLFPATFVVYDFIHLVGTNLESLIACHLLQICQRVQRKSLFIVYMLFPNASCHRSIQCSFGFMRMRLGPNMPHLKARYPLFFIEIQQHVRAHWKNRPPAPKNTDACSYSCI